MKALILIAIASSIALPASAQVAAKKFPAHATVRPVQLPAASLRPTAKTRLSTAQGAAARGNRPPLKQLPAFSVIARDGTVLSSQTLQHKGHWLLLYRRDKCVPCDRLMNVLAAGPTASSNGGQGYSIIVAGQDHSSLDKVRAAYAMLNNANWVGDSKRQAIAALKPRGYPMLYGMDGVQVAWTIPGNLGNPVLVDQRATAWLNAPSTTSAANGTTSAAAPTAPATSTASTPVTSTGK